MSQTFNSMGARYTGKLMYVLGSWIVYDKREVRDGENGDKLRRAPSSQSGQVD